MTDPTPSPSSLSTSDSARAMDTIGAIGATGTTGCDVVIVGGGPAGSTMASFLAEKGWKVIVLEKEHHPRFHIGESLLPLNLPILDRLGYEVTVAIDREIVQYDLDGAMIRFERYPRMDDLVEVEGEPKQIERAIVVLGLPRSGFRADRLSEFARRFEVRTGLTAAVSDEALAACTRFDPANA